MIHILIADDDKYFRMALKNLLNDQAIITEASSEESAIELIHQNYFDIALIDMDIDGPKSGINILKAAQIKKAHTIILSSSNSREIIEEAYMSGCDHFLTKLHYKSNLLPYIYKYKLSLFGQSSDSLFKEKYITQNKDLQQKVKDLCNVNLEGKSILITGETGVGKSLIGKLLHEQTYEENKPFIHLNCSEISENLIESELFGHKKGSFTGAIADKTGKIEQANGGTLFLDEIATMPLIMQQKLLKAIDEKSFYPVGSNKLVTSNFTLITATCEDLFEKINQEKFRKDLFYRISGVNLHISPLRERSGDIELLVEYFLKQSPRRIIINQSALQKLSQHNWPGNIRELKKCVEYLCIKEKGIIEASDINFENNLSDMNPASWLTPQQRDYISRFGLRDFMAKIESESVQDSLSKNDGKITHVIKELKISSSAFYRIFNSLQIHH